MGTSLTGLTPATTYDALIKVGDNGPLSATAKILSDGLGNDSKLNLSTASVGIGTSSPPTIFGVEDTNANVAVINVIGTSPNYIFDVRDDGTSVFRVAGNGNVGIGTSTPSTTLHLDASGGATIRLQRTSASANRFDVGTDGTNMEFNVRDTGNFTFGGTGSYVRLASATGGIQFNGDTAAANALDDYEEGTFTATMTGSVSNPTTAVTTTGSYTKIGNRVMLEVAFLNVDTTGASGNVVVTGMPFMSGASIRTSGSISSYDFSFGGSSNSVYMGDSTTSIEILSSRNGASWVNMTHSPGSGRYLFFSLTYRV